MRTNYSRIAAMVMAVTAGALAAFALRPSTGATTATLAARNPAVEVRTQVIRRTIHVIRHEPAASLRGKRGSSALLSGGHTPARTHTSGSHGSVHAPGAAAAAVATRSSGSHGSASSGPAGTSAAPVATRSSGSHGSASSGPASSSAAPVATRSSGSHGSASSGTSSRPVTRSSGGGHPHGEDGGDGGGRDD